MCRIRPGQLARRATPIHDTGYFSYTRDLGILGRLVILGTLVILVLLCSLSGLFLRGAAGVGEAAQQADQGEQQPLHLHRLVVRWSGWWHVSWMLW